MKLTIFLLEIIYFSVKTGTMKMAKLSELMYNYISTKYDLSIFYDSPELAKDLFK